MNVNNIDSAKFDNRFIPSDPMPAANEAVNIDVVAPDWFSLEKCAKFEAVLNNRERECFHSKRVYRVYPPGTIIVGLGFWQMVRNTWYRLLLRNKEKA
jgi:hypothetical protein